jgi:hypothetical protein
MPLYKRALRDKVFAISHRRTLIHTSITGSSMKPIPSNTELKAISSASKARNTLLMLDHRHHQHP